MISNLLLGKNKEEIKENLKDLSNNELIEKCIIHEVFELLPRDESGNCNYDGNLDCSNNKLTRLPDGLIVGGDLNCSDNNLTNLPDGLQIGENLFCSDQKSGVKLVLPSSAIVKGRFIN